MSNFSDKKILRLATSKDKEEVWMMPGDEPPTNSELSPVNFVKSLSDSKLKYPKIQVVGSKQNIELLILIHEAKKKSKIDISSMEVCTPLCCANSQQRDDTTATLYAMRRWTKWPSSKGGWHNFTDYDYIVYKLALESDLNKLTIPKENVEEFKSKHPLWTYLSFIPTIDEKYSSILVGLILDPRWYIDITNPDRVSKLESFLGIGSKSRYKKRYELLEKAWSNKSNFNNKDLENPRNFLLREAKGLTCDKGMLRASRKFLSYLRLCWLNLIYPKPTESLFDPGLFFSTKSEVSEFNNYMKSFR